MARRSSGYARGELGQFITCSREMTGCEVQPEYFNDKGVKGLLDHGSVVQKIQKTETASL